ncbi:MAG: RecX family transcriptional regulator [Chloroflexi bacterium]|nr:RecX family transcriptional regulator [Chloroflexota bacterium]
MARTAAEAAAQRAARREARGSVTDPDVVMAAAAALLAARPRTVSDTRARLVTMGFTAPLAETVIGRLIDLGYLDDARFAAAWIESRDRSRPRGATALRQELRRKGVETPVIEQALTERAAPAPPGGHTRGATSVRGPDHRPGATTPDTADAAAARRLLDRRSAALLREPDPRKRRQKAYALLARNGFDPGVCAAVARSVTGHEDDPPDAE